MKNAESILSFSAQLSKGRSVKDVVTKSKQHAIGMIRDAEELLNTLEFDGTKKLKISVEIVSKKEHKR